MRSFDYSFLKEKHLNDILRLSAVLSDVQAKEGFRKLQYRDVFEKIRKKCDRSKAEKMLEAGTIRKIGTYKDARYIKTDDIV